MLHSPEQVIRTCCLLQKRYELRPSVPQMIRMGMHVPTCSVPPPHRQLLPAACRYEPAHFERFHTSLNQMAELDDPCITRVTLMWIMIEFLSL